MSDNDGMQLADDLLFYVVDRNRQDDALRFLGKDKKERENARKRSQAKLREAKKKALAKQEELQKRRGQAGNTALSVGEDGTKGVDPGRVKSGLSDFAKEWKSRGGLEYGDERELNAILDGANRFMDAYFGGAIALSNGGVLRFYPDRRAIERLGLERAWMEYAIHAVTQRKSKDDRVRIYNRAKAKAIDSIREIIAADKCVIDKGDLVFIGDNGMSVIAEIVNKNTMRFDEERYITTRHTENKHKKMAVVPLNTLMAPREGTVKSAGMSPSFTSTVANPGGDVKPGNTALSVGGFGLNANARAEMEKVRKQYEGTDKWMKAPNGKPTKLNERQWLQVRTPSFKACFGDWEHDPENASKVVDENGEPLVVHHGSIHSFTVFGQDPKLNKFKERPTHSYMVTPSQDGARRYGNIADLFVNARNVADYRSKEAIREAISRNWEEAANILRLIIPNRDFNSREEVVYFLDGATTKDGRLFQGYENSKLYLYGEEFGRVIQDVIEDDALRNLNADGYLFLDNSGGIRHDSYGLFAPQQLKSATDNVGTFNPENPDIRFSVGERMGGRAPGVDPGGDVREAGEGALAWLRRKFVHSQTPVFDAVRRVMGVGREPPDALNVEAASKNVHGKIRARQEMLQRAYLEPLKAILAQPGMDRKRFDDYALALHALERNRMIQERSVVVDPTTGEVVDLGVEAGSGVTNAWAERVIREIQRDPFAEQYKEAANILAEMNRFVLRGAVADGLLTEAQARTWMRLSPHYVPLKSGGAAPGAIHKRATGRFTRPDSVLVNSMRQAYATVRNGELNRVNKTMADWIREYDPNGEQVGGTVPESHKHAKIKRRNPKG